MCSGRGEKRMKITCQSCGKRYDTDQDELCPRCGSYNPFTRGYDDAAELDGERSYHDVQKYREQGDAQTARPEPPPLQGRPSRTKARRSPARPGGKSPGSVLLQYLIIFVLVVSFVSFAAQKLFELMERNTEQELLEMRVETVEAGSAFGSQDGVRFRVKDVQTIALDEEKTGMIEDYGVAVPEGMELTMVVLKQESDGRFFDYDEMDCYLKENGCVYYPLDNWNLNEAVSQETGITLPYKGSSELRGEKGVLFLTPQQESLSMVFCVQQLERADWADIEKVSSLIQVDITEEAMAE